LVFKLWGFNVNNMSQFDFKIDKTLKGTLARAGVIKTSHGDIKTPAFIVGATKATVKSLTPEMVKGLGAQAVLANTYHLMLRPGTDIVEKAGGLGKFMHWDGPTFTDSGGFQAFSLGMAYKKGIDKVAHSTKGDERAAKHSKDQLAKIDDDGVTFKSHLDGDLIKMTPESSMQLQHQIGADIHFAFDECCAPLAQRDYLEEALSRTHQWAARCIKEHQKLNAKHATSGQHLQALFGVVQGARYEDLRRASAKYLASLEFDGFGIGSVYEPEEIENTVRWVCEELPINKPRHLLGMGSQPADLFLGVEYGIDTFDCVAPTRQARNGALYTKTGRINILNAKYTNDFTPIETDCMCYACQHYTKAYISHLFRSDEILGAVLASIHNEYFVVSTVDNIRISILDGTFMAYKKSFLAKYYNK
jgi:queuine tRNA-ribosyltransferase